MNDRYQPPRSAAWILDRLLPTGEWKSTLGDFEEYYADIVDTHGRQVARLWYWGQLLNLLPRFISNSIYWRLIMLGNYIKLTFRNLMRHKGYASINIGGLAVGLASCLLIALFVQNELSYDDFNENSDRIYRVLNNHHRGLQDYPPPRNEFKAWGSAILGPTLQDDYPEILEVVRFSGRHTILLAHEDRSFQEEQYFYVDPNVFDVFTFPLMQGNPETALVEPYTIVLSETAALRYFGDEDPMGKQLLFSNETLLTVTGVMMDVPRTSHLEFDMLISFATIENTWPDYMMLNWGYVDFFTFVLVPDQYPIENLQANMPEFLLRHRGEPDADAPYSHFLVFEPLNEAYLSPIVNFLPGPTGSRPNLLIFSAIAVFILLIACVNYMNLSTARSSERAREVGVRKVVGAGRSRLVGQFISESVLFSILGVVLSIGLAALALPIFRTISGKEIAAGALLDPAILTACLVVAVIVGLLAGSYPALVLSGFKPVAVLKGTFYSGKKGTLLRQGLVVFQFGISVALIAGTGIVYSQLDYMQTREMGFEKERMLMIDFGGDGIVRGNFDAIRAEFSAHPAVTSISIPRSVPGSYFPQAGTYVEDPERSGAWFTFDIFQVDYDFIEHFGIEMAAGRGYSRDYPSDLDEALVINEAASREIGFANPEEAVGKRFEQWGREGVIIGVARDFNYVSLQEEIRPLSITLSPGAARFVVLNLSSDRYTDTLSEIEDIWTSVAPHRPFLYSFVDQNFDLQYGGEVQFGRIFRVFAGLAIFIACLGLFGLASSITAQRTKEIGVRKVLGASVMGVVFMLSKDFTRLVIVAIVLASPLIYFVMEQWLSAFAYRTTIGIGIFLQAGGLALLIAILTVKYQSIKAAMANPVDSLRSE